VTSQNVHITADGTRLFVAASPGDPGLRATGNGSVVWIADTATLRRIGEIPLPAAAFFVLPTPDGRALIATTSNVPDRIQVGTRLVEVPRGRVLAFWPGPVSGLDVLNSKR
jgi:DNA-binding beta-propeller fold protein YncE